MTLPDVRAAVAAAQAKDAQITAKIKAATNETWLERRQPP
jgi:hypothetical protein